MDKNSWTYSKRQAEICKGPRYYGEEDVLKIRIKYCKNNPDGSVLSHTGYLYLFLRLYCIYRYILD